MRNHLGAFADQLFQSVVVQRHVGGADGRVAHDQVVIGGDQQPRRDVGVVVEVGHDDLVAGRQRARHGVREQEVQRRHVGAESDALRLATGEIGDGVPAAVHDLHRASRRREGPAQVRVGVAQAGGDRVEHLLRSLGATRPV